MVAQNGTAETVEDIPLPCSAQDIIEVPSETVENYKYLLRVPKLRDRARLERKLARLLPRVFQAKELIQVMRDHEEELHRICGKPVLFEQMISLWLDGKFPSYVDVPELEEKLETMHVASMERKQTEEQIEEGKRTNEIRAARFEYEAAILRIDPRYGDIAEDQGFADVEYQIEMVEALLYGVDNGQSRKEDISKEQAGKIMEFMSARDLGLLYLAASDLFNLREAVKKS